MISSIQARLFSRVLSVLGVLALASMTLPHAVAGPIQGAYEIAIASSERLLNAGDLYGFDSTEYDGIQMEESCDNPHYRVRARNKPAVLIQNAESSEGDLTSFTMRINLDAYIYCTGDSAMDGFNAYIKRSAYADPGVDITGSSLSADGQLITVNFAGLSAGKSVLFRVDLDVNPDPIYGDLFPFPDFRTVLFDADEDGKPTGFTGLTSATFSLGESSSTTPETPLFANPDFDFEWEGENTRPYHAIDPVITGGGGGGVPEPTSLLLLLTGLVGVSMSRRTQR